MNPPQNSVRVVGARIEIALAGHLTLANLTRALADVGERLEGISRRIPVLVDCSSMHGYDTDARSFFADWNGRYRTRISRMAIVTHRQIWHLVVSGMALASRQEMKAFSDRASALSWLDS